MKITSGNQNFIGLLCFPQQHIFMLMRFLLHKLAFFVPFVFGCRKLLLIMSRLLDSLVMALVQHQRCAKRT